MYNRHVIDNMLVKQQIEKSIKDLLHNKQTAIESLLNTIDFHNANCSKCTASQKCVTATKTTVDDIERCYDSMIQRQKEFYSNVAIVEHIETKSFYLVYETENVTGTGPFSTLDKAMAWFMNGGR